MENHERNKKATLTYHQMLLQPDQKHFQSTNLASKHGDYDQLVMKTPRKLMKCDVSNNFPYKFLEKKK